MAVGLRHYLWAERLTQSVPDSGTIDLHSDRCDLHIIYLAHRRQLASSTCANKVTPPAFIRYSAERDLRNLARSLREMSGRHAHCRIPAGRIYRCKTNIEKPPPRIVREIAHTDAVKLFLRTGARFVYSAAHKGYLARCSSHTVGGWASDNIR
jgi:hypothetical protein